MASALSSGPFRRYRVDPWNFCGLGGSLFASRGTCHGDNEMVATVHRPAPWQRLSIWPMDFQYSARRSLSSAVGDFFATGAIRKLRRGERSTTCSSTALGRARSFCDRQSCPRIDPPLRDARASARVLAAGSDFLWGNSTLAAEAWGEIVFFS